MGNIINRNMVKNIASDIESSLKNVEKKYNVKITRGNATFGTSNMTLKMNISMIGNDGTVLTKEASDFKTYASIHNVTSKVGDIINHLGVDYKVIGWKPRSTKYPILMEKVSNGGRYKFPVALLPKKSNPTAKKATRVYNKFDC